MSMSAMRRATGVRVSISGAMDSGGEVRAWEATKPAVAGLEVGSWAWRVAKMSRARDWWVGSAESRRESPAAWRRDVGGFDRWRQ